MNTPKCDTHAPFAHTLFVPETNRHTYGAKKHITITWAGTLDGAAVDSYCFAIVMLGFQSAIGVEFFLLFCCHI